MNKLLVLALFGFVASIGAQSGEDAAGADVSTTESPDDKLVDGSFVDAAGKGGKKGGSGWGSGSGSGKKGKKGKGSGYGSGKKGKKGGMSMTAGAQAGVAGAAVL